MKVRNISRNIFFAFLNCILIQLGLLGTLEITSLENET